MEETRQDLLNDLHLSENDSSSSLDQLVRGDSRYIRDLRMNLKGIYKSKVLSEKEVSLLALAIAANNRNETLKNTYTVKARSFGTVLMRC